MKSYLVIFQKKNSSFMTTLSNLFSKLREERKTSKELRTREEVESFCKYFSDLRPDYGKYFACCPNATASKFARIYCIDEVMVCVCSNCGRDYEIHSTREKHDKKVLTALKYLVYKVDRGNVESIFKKILDEAKACNYMK